MIRIFKKTLILLYIFLCFNSFASQINFNPELLQKKNYLFFNKNLFSKKNLLIFFASVLGLFSLYKLFNNNNSTKKHDSDNSDKDFKYDKNDKNDIKITKDNAVGRDSAFLKKIKEDFEDLTLAKERNELIKKENELMINKYSCSKITNLIFVNNGLDALNNDDNSIVYFYDKNYLSISFNFYYGFYIKWINDFQKQDNIEGYFDALNNPLMELIEEEKILNKEETISKKNIKINTMYSKSSMHANIYLIYPEKKIFNTNIMQNMIKHLNFFNNEPSLRYYSTLLSIVGNPGHTICFAIDKIKKKFYIINSLGKGYFSEKDLKNLKNQINEEYIKKYKDPVFEGYSCEYIGLDIQHGMQCGLYACCFSYAFAVEGLEGVKKLIYGFNHIKQIKESKDLSYETIKNIEIPEDLDIFNNIKKQNNRSFFKSLADEIENIFFEDKVKKFSFYFTTEEYNEIKEKTNNHFKQYPHLLEKENYNPKIILESFMQEKIEEKNENYNFILKNIVIDNTNQDIIKR